MKNSAVQYCIIPPTQTPKPPAPQPPRSQPSKQVGSTPPTENAIPLRCNACFCITGGGGAGTKGGEGDCKNCEVRQTEVEQRSESCCMFSEVKHALITKGRLDWSCRLCHTPLGFGTDPGPTPNQKHPGKVR